jgi:uncharacterized membrane protein YebE (DUF533 family)
VTGRLQLCLVLVIALLLPVKRGMEVPGTFCHLAGEAAIAAVAHDHGSGHGAGHGHHHGDHGAPADHHHAPASDPATDPSQDGGLASAMLACAVACAMPPLAERAAPLPVPVTSALRTPPARVVAVADLALDPLERPPRSI